MAITGKSLADGQLANVKATLYTCPASTIAHVTGILLANTSSATGYTFNVYIKRSGSTSRRIVGKDKTMNASDDYATPVSGQAVRLSAGDIIEGDASVANVIDYTICGGTEGA